MEMESKSDRLDGINTPREAADKARDHIREAEQILDGIGGLMSHARPEPLRRAADHLQKAADIQEAANEEFGVPEQ